MDEATQQALAQYVRDLFAPEDEALQSIRAISEAEGLPQIHIRPEEGRMLLFLLAAIGAWRVVEIGTLGGYSGTWIARALPPGGRLVTLERDPRHGEIARASFERAGVADRVEVRLGDARQLLEKLGSEGPFDAVFIDARKADYPFYLAWAVDHVRIGGLVMAHNALWSGRVVQEAAHPDAELAGVLEFNRQMASDPRLLGTIIPVGDGIAAAVRAR